MTWKRMTIGPRKLFAIAGIVLLVISPLLLNIHEASAQRGGRGGGGRAFSSCLLSPYLRMQLRTIRGSNYGARTSPSLPMHEKTLPMTCLLIWRPFFSSPKP